ASVRTDKGKGASRRLRRLNKEIPAVLYGGNEDPVSLRILHDDMFHATENEAFFSHIITLNIGGDKQQCVIKDLQRHPAKPFLLHADFLRVRADQEINVNVPVHFLNEEKCKGVRLEGGNLIRNLTEIEVSCLPKDLPEYIEIDVLDLQIGDSIHLSEVKLPAGVESVDLSHGDGYDETVVQVQAPRTEAEVDEADTAVEVPDAEVPTDQDEDEGEESSDKED
ncbi:MAG: 50S ribosomal protein L25/general stress protein Ctc, partial [Pseudohongiellaceae bacterium]